MPTLPHKRKIENAFAGYLIDLQAADDTVLAGLTIVCGATARSPDYVPPEDADPKAEGIEPELPYLSVSCGKIQADPEMPTSTGVKLADLIFHFKTHSSDEARAAADERLGELEQILQDVPSILATLNIPASPAPDTRRVTALYLYDVYGEEQADEHDAERWIDQVAVTVSTNNWDPQ